MSGGGVSGDPDAGAVGSMTAAMEAFAASIGPALSDLDVPWGTVWVVTEMEPTFAAYYAYYLASDDRMTVRSLSVPDAIQDAFRQLWESARADNPDSPWTTATLAVARDPAGQASFRIDYGYDPVPIEAEMARRRAWRTRNLPAGARVVHQS